MAKLATKQRKKLSKSDFAVPSKSAYPIPDQSHARNALARVSQFGSPKEKSMVKRKVKKKFTNIKVSK